MPAVLNVVARDLNIGAGVTRYSRLGDTSTIANATETVAQITYRTAGVFSKLYARVITNDCAASTIRLRINAANVNLVLSVGASTTGEFLDSTNTDTAAAGDEVALQFVTGAGTTFQSEINSILFSAISGAVKKFVTDAVTNVTTDSTTFFMALSGLYIPQTTEAPAQYKAKVAGTLQNLCVNTRTNGRSTSSTVGIRKNGASGNLTVSVGAGTTGLVEDTSNTDSVAVDDLINVYVTTGTGGGNLECNPATEFSTAGAMPLIGSSFIAAGFSFAASTTTYMPVSGRVVSSATESQYQTDALYPSRLSRLACYVSANTIVGASTMRTRIGAGNGNQSLSLTGLTTGYFEDASNTDDVLAASEINLQMVTDAAGTSLQITTIALLASPLGGGPIVSGGSILKGALLHGGRIAA